MQDIVAPGYYASFSCVGSRCEDTCCNGWTVSLDEATYQRYLQIEHPVLAPLVEIAVSKNMDPQADSEQRHAFMRMKPDNSCYFEQSDHLCAIHALLGEQALSDTCRTYPRYYNQFGAQLERALSISCPEAARLILLEPEPMRFDVLPALDERPFTSCRFPSQSEGDPEQIAILNDFRSLIIVILQCRSLSIGARLMLLGWLLEDAGGVIAKPDYAHASELLGVLQGTAAMLAQPQQIEQQFAKIPGDVPRKLALLNRLILHGLKMGASARFNRCALAAARGLVPEGVCEADLLRHFHSSFASVYQPFMATRQHIFENYLVNMVVIRLFPFTRGSYLALYRELVFNVSMLQTLLHGLAIADQGLSEERVIELFQSFARKTDHNRKHLDSVAELLQVGEQDSFAQVMWLLKH